MLDEVRNALRPQQRCVFDLLKQGSGAPVSHDRLRSALAANHQIMPVKVVLSSIRRTIRNLGYRERIIIERRNDAFALIVLAEKAAA